MRGCILILACFLAGCSGEERAKRLEAERARQEQEAAASAKRKAERDAETALMSDLLTAVPALEQRLREWISVKEGLILVREPDGKAHSEWHVMPMGVPWVVTCQGGAVSATLGSWISGDRDSVWYTYEKELSFTRLPDDQCKALALKTGERMSAILRGE